MKKDKEVTAEVFKEAFPEIIWEIQNDAFNAGSAKGYLDGEAQIKRGGTMPTMSMSIAPEVMSEIVSAVGPNASPILVPYEKARFSKSDFKRAYPEVFAELEKVCFAVGYQRGLFNAQLQVDFISMRDNHNPVSTMKAPVTQVSTSPASPVLPAMTLEEQVKHDWDTNAAVRREFGNNFLIYKAFQDAVAAGLVKIYGRQG